MKVIDTVSLNEFLILPRKLKNKDGIKEWRWMRRSQILWDIVEMMDLTPAMPSCCHDRTVVKYVAKQWLD